MGSVEGKKRFLHGGAIGLTGETVDAGTMAVLAQQLYLGYVGNIQLAALLVGFANEERPVTAATVAAALDDLKGLPLPWNIPVSPDSVAIDEEPGFGVAVDDIERNIHLAIRRPNSRLAR